MSLITNNEESGNEESGNKKKDEWIKKLLKNKKYPIMIILAEFFDETLAYNYEYYLINNFYNNLLNIDR